MMPEPVLVGIGMVTAVGLSASETAASVRAGTARFTATKIQDKAFEPFTVAEVPEAGLPKLAERVDAAGLSAREARMIRLATSALRECLKNLPAREARPPLVLALPESLTARELQGVPFLSHLAEQTGGIFDLQRSDASLRGRAGGLAAVAHAAEMIRGGHTNVMIAGGVDTFRDLYVLGSLDLESRVKSSSNLDGFIPGEGAAFLLLCSRAAATGSLRPLAQVSTGSIALEAGHLLSAEPYRGDGLATALQQLVSAGALGAPVKEVYSSMNGERYWAKEWGVARIRAGAAFSDDHGMHHPAECFGDLGAAIGPALVGLSALGITGGYRNSPALVYASSDGGPRAALVVGRV